MKIKALIVFLTVLVLANSIKLKGIDPVFYMLILLGKRNYNFRRNLQS